MNDPSIRNPAYQQLTDEQLSEFDELCDRFDQELADGRGPRIETFLADSPEAARDGLLAELLAMELEYRVQQGDFPQPDEYVGRFPQRESTVADVFGVATQAPATRATSIPVNVPPSLENFRLIDEIGRGGMGVVWLAEQDKPVKRRVALKLIKSELTSDDVIARFDAEKQALAMMDHPNIARVLDAGATHDGRPYFVMELVDGIPITQYCDDNKLSVDDRLKLFVPVCKAVQHAHQMGIIHRDLKPSNVLVTVIDGEAVPKVIDFGLAKAVDQHLLLTDATMQTEFGKVVGTVEYMSPEQAELKGMDGRDVDTRTDVYSLGVMLYELLTGSTPLDKATLGRNALLKVLEFIREVEPPRPSLRLRSSSHEVSSVVSDLRRLNPARLRQLLRGELDCVVMKALEKDRDRRYQTANDLADDLSSYLTGETVRARPPSTWYQLRKFARRNRGLVAAVLTIGVALLVGVAGTSYGLVRANQKTRLAKDKTDEAEKERVNAVESNARATAESQHARDAEATARFQLAVARFDTHRAVEARNLLHQIPPEYRDNFEWHYCNRRFQGSDVTCYGPTRPVYEVAFTPDGTRVVSAGEGGTIRQWDAATGQELRALKGHQGRVFGLAVSPDGSRIASAGDDRSVRLWDAQSGEVNRKMGGHTDSINGLAFSPTGDRIASASGDKTIKLWDTKTGAALVTITGHTAAVRGVAFSPDGKRIASTSDDESVRIWDARSGKQIAVVRSNSSDTRRVAFSPDGTRLATIGLGRFSLWDTRTWQLVVKGELAHERIVQCVAFSPDGTRLATGGDDTTIKLWDTRSGKGLATLSGHADTVWGLAFSPDGSRLVSGSRDRTVRIWNTRGGNELTLKGHSSAVFCVAFSPNGKYLASGESNGTILLRDARTYQVLFPLKGHTRDVADLSFSPDGKRLASGADDNTARVWNTQTGEAVAVLNGHTHWVTGVAYRPDGGRLATCSRDGSVRLWDTHTHQETATLKGHRGFVYCVAFSPDGLRLASAGFDNTIRLWDARTGKELQTFRDDALVRSVAFGPRGKRLVSAGYGTKIRVWDVASGKQVTAINRSWGAVFGVAFSPNGRRIASACTDRAVHLFDARDGREIMILNPGSAGCRVVKFSPDGRRLAGAVTRNNTVRIWDATRNHETTILTGHRDTITRVTFSLDGQRIYSESETEKLVWNSATGKQIPEAKWQPPKVQTYTSPDGRWFVTKEMNHVVLVDRRFNNTPDERALRVANATFDPDWHRSQAKAAATAENWYAAAFHHAWLCRHEPGSLAHFRGMQSSYRRLTDRNSGATLYLAPLVRAAQQIVEKSGRGAAVKRTGGQGQ